MVFYNNYENLCNFIIPYNNIKHRKILGVFHSLERYICISTIQQDRVIEGVKKIASKGSHISTDDELPDIYLIYADLHFLLISLEICYKLELQLFDMLYKTLDKKDLENSTVCTNIRRMRNALEHMDENLVSKSKAEYDIPETYASFNWLEYQMTTLQRGVFTIKNMSIDLTSDLVEEICAYYQKILRYIYHLPHDKNFE